MQRPYDTVLNDADNVPGGEPATDGTGIASRCSSVGQARFNLALGAGVMAVLFGFIATRLALRHPPSERTNTSETLSV